MILVCSFSELPWQAWVIGGITALIVGLLAFLAIKFNCFTFDPYDKEDKDNG